jgi:hypothetical protein
VRELVGGGVVDARLVHPTAQALVEAPSAESLCDKLIAALFSAWRTRLAASVGFADDDKLQCQPNGLNAARTKPCRLRWKPRFGMAREL